MPQTVTGQTAATPTEIATQILTLATALREADAVLYASIVRQMAAQVSPSLRPTILSSSFGEKHPVWEAFETFVSEDREQERQAIGNEPGE